MQTQPYTARSSTALFGPNYGYRFNGDCVELHASFQIHSEETQHTSWLIQLRASPANKSTPEPLATHLVAEVSLPPFNQFAFDETPFYLTATATPPAGSGEFNLYLVLVSKDATGSQKSHDVAFFDHPERFVQPRFTGEVSHQITGDHVRLSVASLENPRDPANLSGTLALELWALAESYTGGNFQGAPLAGVIIGHVTGELTLQNLAYDLALTPPPPGRWQLVLMLREWTSNGFTTRDYFNFSLPLEIAAPAPALPEPVTTPTKPATILPAPVATPKLPPEKTASPTKASKTAVVSKPKSPSASSKGSKKTRR